MLPSGSLSLFFLFLFRLFGNLRQKLFRHPHNIICFQYALRYCHGSFSPVNIRPLLLQQPDNPLLQLLGRNRLAEYGHIHSRCHPLKLGAFIGVSHNHNGNPLFRNLAFHIDKPLQVVQVFTIQAVNKRIRPYVLYMINDIVITIRGAETLEAEIHVGKKFVNDHLVVSRKQNLIFHIPTPYIWS